MKTYNHLYSAMTELESFLSENGINRSEPMLMRIHTGVHDEKGMSELLEQLKEKLPNAVIVGCSTRSVIFNGRSMTGVCMLSITLIDNCQVKSAHLPCFENGEAISGKTLAERICESLELYDKNGQLVVFLPQNYMYCTGFADGINELAPNIRLIGGIADDPQFSIATTGKIEDIDITFTQESCGHGSLVAAVIASPELHCFEGYALGMEKLTKPLPVTSYDKNIISSVGGRPPMEWMGDFNDECTSEKNINIIRIFPIYRKKYENIAWPVNFVKEGEKHESVMIMDVLSEGEEVGIGYLGPNSVVDDVVYLYRKMKRYPSETFFVYSCSLRAEILQNCSEWELSPLKDTTASGAFLGGEFLYDGRKNYFGNCTFVVSALATSDTYISLDTQPLKDTHNLYHDNEPLINFFALNAVDASYKNNDVYKQLEARLYSDKSVEVGNLMKMFGDIPMKKLNKLCMIGIRNGSELIAYGGYKAYDNMFKRLITKIQHFMGTFPVYYYVSEQGEILLASGIEISAMDYERRIRELFDYLSIIEYNRLAPIFEFCLVLNNKHLFRNVKAVQSILHNRKDIRFMVYSDDMGVQENCVHDVRIAQVVSEAIANDRVMPFYQGIYDNSRRSITMYESLMRIYDDDGRIYYPNDFLSVAKKYGLYGPLSYQMIERVLNTFEKENGLVTMNLSMHDLLDKNMTGMIYTYMRKSSNPEKYIFEITEGEDITDYSVLYEFSETLHSYGCKIALDDFGSGFSNLIHVINMDLDFLKIDGGIIKQICDDENCRKLLEIVTMWCKHNGKKIIAEFVENVEIQDILCEYEVEYSQGYLFSKPEKLF